MLAKTEFLSIIKDLRQKSGQRKRGGETVFSLQDTVKRERSCSALQKR